MQESEGIFLRKVDGDLRNITWNKPPVFLVLWCTFGAISEGGLQASQHPSLGGQNTSNMAELKFVYFTFVSR